MVMIKIQVYFSLFETVLRVSNFLVFSPLILIWPLIVLNFDLFVESARKTDTRQFMKIKHF